MIIESGRVWEGYKTHSFRGGIHGPLPANHEQGKKVIECTRHTVSVSIQTKHSKRSFIRHLRCCRYVFNHFLVKRKEVYEAEGKTLGYNTCSSLLTQLKKELQWLKEPDTTALQTELRHLDDAFKRFFREKKGYPRFKSRKNPVQSYTSKNNKGTIAIKENRIRLPKLGWVKFAKSREIQEEDHFGHHQEKSIGQVLCVNIGGNGDRAVAYL